MNLVIIQNRQAVTTSLQVAESFEKRHDNVLREIEGLLKIEEAKKYFHKGTYEHPQNKQEYPLYFMNRDGFTLLAMGFTGQKAIQFKLAYIQAFNKMELHIQQEQLPSDPIELALETSLKNYQEIKEIKGDVDLLKNSMRIDGAQEFALNSQGKAKVLEVLGGYESPAYNAVSKKVFAQLWRDFKKYFKLPRYSELPKSKFDDAVYFISKWQPDTAMLIEIEHINRQGRLKLAN